MAVMIAAASTGHRHSMVVLHSSAHRSMEENNALMSFRLTASVVKGGFARFHDIRCILVSQKKIGGLRPPIFLHLNAVSSGVPAR